MAMPTPDLIARTKLEQMALILFEQDLDAWPMAGLVAHVKDNADGLRWTHSAKSRRLKKQIDRFLMATALEHDLIETPSKAQH